MDILCNKFRNSICTVISASPSYLELLPSIVTVVHKFKNPVCTVIFTSVTRFEVMV